MNTTSLESDELFQSAFPDHEVIIVGAGISGIGTAIQLKADGIYDIKVNQLIASVRFFNNT